MRLHVSSPRRCRVGLSPRTNDASAVYANHEADRVARRGRTEQAPPSPPVSRDARENLDGSLTCRPLLNLGAARGRGEAREMAFGGRRGSSRWGLPVARSEALGKLGPSFGIGAGCGVGIGVGLIGGAGIGAGFPGLQLGFGAGAGCGIGIGFGYGFGKGIAYDENGRHSNIRRSFQSSKNPPYDERFDILFDELIESTRKMIKATSKEVDKWRRM